jgi:hypothetical protein
MKLKFLTISLFFIGLLNSFSQDIITKKDGTKMEVIIKEVNDKTIKYVDFKDPNGVIFTIDKVLVRDVKFSYGKDLEIKNPEEDALYFADDKLNNWLFNFSSFGGNTLGLAYERALKPGQSIMAEAKIYGLGIKRNFEDNRTGFGLDVFYRLKTKSLFSRGEYRPKHLLHGAYFSPVIGFSTGEINYDNNTTDKHTIFHFGIHYGKQWILQRTLSVDASIGVHYYLGSDDDSNNYEPLKLGNMVGGDSVLFGFNFRIGFLSGKKNSIK